MIFLQHIPYYSGEYYDLGSPLSSLIDLSFLDFSTSVATSDSLIPLLKCIEPANSESTKSNEHVGPTNFNSLLDEAPIADPPAPIAVDDSTLDVHHYPFHDRETKSSSVVSLLLVQIIMSFL